MSCRTSFLDHQLSGQWNPWPNFKNHLQVINSDHLKRPFSIRLLCKRKRRRKMLLVGMLGKADFKLNTSRLSCRQAQIHQYTFCLKHKVWQVGPNIFSPGETEGCWGRILCQGAKKEKAEIIVLQLQNYVWAFKEKGSPNALNQKENLIQGSLFGQI